jgi:vancomycin permeability regulator SanA
MYTVAIVLGYKLNKDSSMDNLLVKRLKLTLKLLNEEKIDKVILSGGCPVSGQKYSEAEAMAQYLIANGVNPEIIVKEENSLTTVENAKYSIPIAKELGATRIIVVTTLEHMARPFLNPISIFSNEIKDNNISTMYYTNCSTKEIE